jgi:hypothetical protein
MNERLRGWAVRFRTTWFGQSTCTQKRSTVIACVLYPSKSILGRGTSRETSAVEFESAIGQSSKADCQSINIIYKIFNIMRYTICSSMQIFTCCNMDLAFSLYRVCKQTTYEEISRAIAHVMTINPSRHHDNTPRSSTTYSTASVKGSVGRSHPQNLQVSVLRFSTKAPTTPRAVFGTCRHPTSNSHQSTAFHMPPTSAPLTRMRT